MAFTSEIKMPTTKREGLENFIQMVINKLEAGDARNALLTAVDLLEDVRCGQYDDAMVDAKGRDRLAAELQTKHTADVIASHGAGYDEGMRVERQRVANLLGLVT